MPDNFLNSLAETYTEYLEEMEVASELEQHTCRQMTTRPMVTEKMENEAEMLCYGPIIYKIVKTADGWLAHNEEYGSVISFCPFCGERLS